MAQTPTPGNHSFQNYNGWARYKTPATTVWGTTANSCTITDAKISVNSFVLVIATGSNAPNGDWSYTTTNGQVVITSSNAESATLPLSYIIL